MASKIEKYLELHVLYEIPIKSLELTFGTKKKMDLLSTLSNGRGSYLVFEALIRELTGLVQGKKADHADVNGRLYEQKSYVDLDNKPRNQGKIHTGASGLFANNSGAKAYKELLKNQDYVEAMRTCKNLGYASNSFYIYTNTGEYNISVPFRFMTVESKWVIKNVEKENPAILKREKLLNSIISKTVLK